MYNIKFETELSDRFSFQSSTLDEAIRFACAQESFGEGVNLYLLAVNKTHLGVYALPGSMIDSHLVAIFNCDNGHSDLGYYEMIDNYDRLISDYCIEIDVTILEDLQLAGQA